MTFTAEPLQVPSLKKACVTQLEEQILSGQLKIGEKLPSERKLADMLNISRPVVHEALVDLAAKGLVEISPRRGVFVTDYRTTGSCALLTTLLSYHQGELDDAFFHSLAEMRILLEVETAQLAAHKRSTEQLQELQDLVDQEMSAGREDPTTLAELDFQFHLLVALASGNLMYPLVINSFKPVYTNLTGRFFQKHSHNTLIIDQVYEYHHRLLSAFSERDSQTAAAIMTDMLQHGQDNL